MLDQSFKDQIYIGDSTGKLRRRPQAARARYDAFKTFNCSAPPSFNLLCHPPPTPSLLQQQYPFPTLPVNFHQFQQALLRNPMLGSMPNGPALNLPGLPQGAALLPQLAPLIRQPFLVLPPGMQEELTQLYLNNVQAQQNLQKFDKI